MRFHQFDLNLLVYLDALLSEMSVSKAAARVSITQPATSEALARLREYFKDDLLVHVAGRSMILTPLAQSLINPVREILLRAQSVAAARMDFVPAKSDRKISIMASDYVFDVILKKVLVCLYCEAPGVRLEVRRHAMDGREQIKRSDLDLLVGPLGYISEELPFERLFEDPLTCVVWSGNKLVGEKISFEQYMDPGHICSITEGHIPVYDEWFRERFGSKRKVEVAAPDHGYALRGIEGTNRIATVPRRHARMYARQFSLRLLDPPIEFPPLTEYLQWHRHQERDPGLVWFRNLIKTVAAAT